jgi:YggT family protein
MRELLADAIHLVVGFFVWAFLVRLLFQLLKTDFRNPFAQAIVKLTNPLVLPLRRVLPAIGRIDTASVVALLVVQAADIALVRVVVGYGLPDGSLLIVETLLELLRQTLQLFLVAVIIWAILSWVAPDGYNPAARLLSDLVTPVLRPIRRILPRLEGLDLSPMVACALLLLLLKVIDRFGAQLLVSIG